MTEHDPELISKFLEVFFPYAKERTDKFKKENGRFAYYTSADTASKILKNKEVWLRNARLMNDYSEVTHGADCLQKTWDDSEINTRIAQLCARIGSDVMEQIRQDVGNSFAERVYQTYIICVSEHGSALLDDNGQPVKDEDRYGRLSMWRAYGGDTNVAFLFKNAPFFNDNVALPAFTSPVLYADQEKFKQKFMLFLDNLEANIDWLKEMGANNFVRTMNDALVTAMLSTKHPAFAEEREWRIIYSPTVWPSENMKPSVEVIGGIPQHIIKLPLKDIPDQGLTGITLPDFLDKIIVGPTPEPIPIADALASLMSKAGIPAPNERISISDIPLRR